MSITSIRLRRLRESRNLSQQEVADAIGISRTAYNKYERGVAQPTRNIRKLSTLFGVSTDYILGIDQKKIQKTRMVSKKSEVGELVSRYLLMTEDEQKAILTLIRSMHKKDDGNDA